MFLATGYARSLAAVSAPQGGAGLVLLVWLAGLASSYFSKRTLAEVVYSESDSANSVSLQKGVQTQDTGACKKKRLLLIWRIRESATQEVIWSQRRRHTGGYVYTLASRGGSAIILSPWQNAWNNHLIKEACILACHFGALGTSLVGPIDLGLCWHIYETE